MLFIFRLQIDTSDTFWGNVSRYEEKEENTTFLQQTKEHTSVMQREKNSMNYSDDRDLKLEDDKITSWSTLDVSILSCILCLVVISLYQKVNFILKLLLMTLTATVQITIYTCISKTQQREKYSRNEVMISSSSLSSSSFHVKREILTWPTNLTNISMFSNDEESIYYEWPSWLEPALLMSLLIILLHILDRQIELTSRSDFLWMTKLRSEEDGGDTMLGINKVIKQLALIN